MTTRRWMKEYKRYRRWIGHRLLFSIFLVTDKAIASLRYERGAAP